MTAYDPAERYAAGDFVDQHPGDAGPPASSPTTTPSRTPTSCFSTFGLTHFPRPEDWPVMPTDHTGSTLEPVGFFERNPALGVPRSTSSHCATGEGQCS